MSRKTIGRSSYQWEITASAEGEAKKSGALYLLKAPLSLMRTVSTGRDTRVFHELSLRRRLVLMKTLIPLKIRPNEGTSDKACRGFHKRLSWHNPGLTEPSRYPAPKKSGINTSCNRCCPISFVGWEIYRSSLWVIVPEWSCRM